MSNSLRSPVAVCAFVHVGRVMLHTHSRCGLPTRTLSRSELSCPRKHPALEGLGTLAGHRHALRVSHAQLASTTLDERRLDFSNSNPSRRRQCWHLLTSNRARPGCGSAGQRRSGSALPRHHARGCQRAAHFGVSPLVGVMSSLGVLPGPSESRGTATLGLSGPHQNQPTLE